MWPVDSFLCNIEEIHFGHPRLHQQQCATEKSTKLGHWKGAGIAGNPDCEGVGKISGWCAVGVACMSVWWCFVIGLGSACQLEEKGKNSEVVVVGFGTHHHHTAHSNMPCALASTAHHPPRFPLQHTQDYWQSLTPSYALVLCSFSWAHCCWLSLS